MTIEAPATTVDPSGPVREPQIAIALAKAKLPDEIAACVLEVTVEQTADHADHLSLRLATWNPDPGKPTWIDDSRFAAGAALELKIGYGETLDKVFDGDIVGLGLELHATEPPVMTVDAYNRLHRLGRGRQPPAKKPKSNSTYGDLITAIAKRYDLTAKVEGSDADKQNETVNQQNESDLEFVGKLAAEIGYVFYVDGQDLVFRKDAPGTQPPVKLAQSQLLEMSGHIDFASQVGAIDGFAFDHDGNKRIPYKKANPDSLDKSFGKEEISIARPLSVDHKEQLQTRVDAELLRIRNSYLSVTATCFGRTDVKVGMTVELQLDKIAERFKHSYTVSAVSHSFSQAAGFRTRLTLKGTRS
jgi:phage protein D